MADPITLPLLGLGIASGAASAGLAAKAQSDQNKSLTEAQAANQQAAQTANLDSAKAAAIQRQQLADQTGLERAKAAAEVARSLGRLRVIQADTGLGIGGSALALQRQLAYDARLNDAIAVRNLSNNVQRVNQGLEANVNETNAQLKNVTTQLQSQKASPFIAGFSSGVGGFGTGLSIATGIKGLQT